jgi:membrane protease YdiL (CAAX protease family)
MNEVPVMSAVPPKPTQPNRPLAEVLVVFAVTTAATAVITRLPAVLPGIEGYVHLLVGALFLMTAVKLAQREPNGMERHGIDLSGVLTPPDADDERPAGPLGLYDLARALKTGIPAALKESGVALGIALVVFPAFALGFYFWHGPEHPLQYNPPDDFVSFALTQLLVVALPEEALFRGYMQTRLHDKWPAQREIFGVKIDLRVLLLQAALFAILHYASITNPARLAVFFPALLFGVLRAWRGGIGAAMLFHAMSNVLAELLERGWLA